MQLLHVKVTNLKAHLEQSAILSILSFVEQLTFKLNQLAPEQSQALPAQAVDSDTETLTSKKQAKSKTLGNLSPSWLVVLLYVKKAFLSILIS